MSSSDAPKILFNDKRPDSLFKSSLYDPDLHGSDYVASGKVLGKEGSIVIDDVMKPVYGSYIPYVIERFDPVTFKSTLAPLKILLTSEGDNETKIISYGNDRFMLHYDDRVRPVCLVPDAKLIIFGNANVEYRLVRTNEEGQDEIISAYLDATEKFISDRIPLTPLGNTGAKACTDCHTLYTMQDGDVVHLEVFNSAGVLTARVELHTLRATILNDLASSSNPITNFDAECLQMLDSGEFFVYEKQDPEHIGITPYVEYADGTKEIVTVDKRSCFIYGLDDFIPSYPGYKQRLIIKYFLNFRQSAADSVNIGKHRFLVVEKDLVVVSNQSTFGMKLAVLPIWIPSQRKWSLRFFAYTDRRDAVYDVTGDVTWVSAEFDGIKFNQQQHLIFEVNLSAIYGNSYNATYRQALWLTVRDYTQYERYILKDSADDEYAYGVEASTARRPVMHYDATLEQYFVPTSVFGNKAAFLEAFYKWARPPFNANVETLPPTPTHFTVRSSTAQVILTTPIPVDEYNQVWNCILSGSADQLVGSNIIVEFLQKIGDTYQILYGVPVDVHLSKTGYNTELNPAP